MLDKGIVDTSDVVRDMMLNAGMALIEAYGGAHPESLLPIFQKVIEQAPKAGEDVQAFDWRREGAVVFLGMAAR